MGLFTSGSKASPKLYWEPLKNEGTTNVIRHTYRTKVPGGWLVTAADTQGVGATFIPDPNHEWDGNSLE